METYIQTYAYLHNIFPEVKQIIMEADATKKEELKKKLIEGSAHEQYSRFDKQLAENNGYFGGKVS